MVAEVTPAELADRIDSGERFTLIDTRPAESFRSWHVAGAENYPYAPGEDVDPDAIDDLIEDGEPILAVCAKGKSSSAFVDELEALGYDDVAVVSGGMEAWSQVYEQVSIEVDDLRPVVQIQRRAKGCLGYLIGCVETGEAAAVDVTRHTAEFRETAEKAGYEITRVFDTHVHADHVSGGRALADELGVPYHLGEAAVERGVEYDFEPVGNGEVVEVGDVDVEAIHTPGHTSEIVSYLVDGSAVLTGDTLFVDSVGRTELQFGDADAEKGARMLYESLHDRLLALPDDVAVLPGHATVTDEGEWEPGEPGEPVRSTVGDLRASLPVLGLDQAAFVERIAGSAPEKPPNYGTIIAVNTGRRSVDDERATELELGPNRCAAA